ncbi:MAG: amidohydrolase family protein [Planctomycetota bacterium]|nr:MAG: amidohydrolase family protein [Planctomycetota bacterium]
MKNNKKSKTLISRRSTLKGIGAAGALAFLSSKTAVGEEKTLQESDLTAHLGNIRKKIFQKVFQTPFIDTHEHLPDESKRLSPAFYSYGNNSDDWTIVFRGYLQSDMRSAGMSEKDHRNFFSPGVDPLKKWAFLEPVWPFIKNTGYGQAVRISVKELYGVEELTAETIGKVQAGYEKVRRPGFYKRILCDLAKIESCQVNSGDGFHESNMPTLLMQDIGIVGMLAGPNLEHYSKPTGIKVTCLNDWHKVIDWWFDKYGKYAVAVKSQNAYDRNIDYEKVPSEKVDVIFSKRLSGQSLTAKEQKALEDHLFWYAVDKATEHNLPVKLHTGYYAIWGDKKPRMPLSRLIHNPGAATDLCRMSPQTRFVFMHICYPYYEELISIAKHYPNAYVDMCWSWIINPVAAKDFLKKYLVAVPANKILTFGGDYSPVEPVLGHALIARHGIALALSELVEEKWLSLNDALELTDPIMHGNARRIFNLAEKEKILKKVKRA